MKWMKPKGMGGWAFLLGFFGAIVLGLLAGLGTFTAGASLVTVLVVAGIVIGLLNVTGKEALVVMVAALVLGGGAGIMTTLPFVGGIIEQIFINLASVMMPAAMVIAIKAVYEKAR